jgi:hypothetical protein
MLPRPTGLNTRAVRDSKRDLDSGVGSSVCIGGAGSSAGALTARRSRADCGCAIVVGRVRMLINVSVAARPVGWEHGSTVEVASTAAD